LAAEPLARAVADRSMVPGQPLAASLRPAALVGGHAVACLAVSRTAGLQVSAGPALVIAALLLVATVGASAYALVPRPARLLEDLQVAR
jgi:hypothetical protein